MTALATAPATAAAGIIGLGSYRPSRRVTNDELAGRIDSSDEWIRERTGIVERRFGAADETCASMGAIAAQRALDDAGRSAQDVDVVIVATFTHRVQTPSAAIEIAHLIGADSASGFDLSAACAGFCYGLAIADALVRSGQASTVLLIGTEKLSDFMNFDDRGTAFIFADGAGAVVVAATPEPGISATVWGADGSALDAITMEPNAIMARTTGQPSLLTMQGQRVFRWAVGTMGGVCEQALQAAGVRKDELAAFVPHQANLRITKAISERLDLPGNVVIADDIVTAGNTSAASIPLALDALRSAGKVGSGDLVLTVGFGAGVAYAAQVIRTP
jgi:3-oxoacyl-[acyl-carrier-protein] synthase-3